jgi:competence protein ComEC
MDSCSSWFRSFVFGGLPKKGRFMKIFFAGILFFGSSIGHDPANYFIIWNVGQGSWSTLVKSQECLHYDVGGEKFPEAVKTLCSQKRNKIYISHDDWDHIRFLKVIRKWRNVCLADGPRKFFSTSKEKLIEKFAICSDSKTEIGFQALGKTANDLSRVYFEKNPGVLIPGDSSRSAEKIWAPLVAGNKIHWWLLGHHGSLTSNSKLLIEKIGHPIAIASARWKVYHHPHPLVIARLKMHGIPTLRTEDWGNFWILL